MMSDIKGTIVDCTFVVVLYVLGKSSKHEKYGLNIIKIHCRSVVIPRDD